MRREAAFQTKFNEWLRGSYKGTGAFELKETDGPLPFIRVEAHQKNSLSAAKHGILAYKIPDDSRSFKPFDCFSLSGVPSYIVVKYRRGDFYLIDVDTFIEEDRRSVRRSLTESRAAEIALFRGTERP